MLFIYISLYVHATTLKEEPSICSPQNKRTHTTKSTHLHLHLHSPPTVQRHDVTPSVVVFSEDLVWPLELIKLQIAAQKLDLQNLGSFLGAPK